MKYDWESAGITGIAEKQSKNPKASVEVKMVNIDELNYKWIRKKKKINK